MNQKDTTVLKNVLLSNDLSARDHPNDPKRQNSAKKRSAFQLFEHPKQSKRSKNVKQCSKTLCFPMI